MLVTGNVTTFFPQHATELLFRQPMPCCQANAYKHIKRSDERPASETLNARQYTHHEYRMTIKPILIHAH